MKPGIAAKSFIVNEKGELLLIKRSRTDPNKPGAWEVPGGRLGKGEEIEQGLKRETKEETGLDIEIMYPLRVRDFRREDGQQINITTFLCRLVSGQEASVVLSSEHSDYTWMKLEQAKSRITPFFHEEVDAIKAESGKET